MDKFKYMVWETYLDPLGKYFFMLFIYVPVFLYIILNMLHIKIDLTTILSMNTAILALIVLLIFLFGGFVSFNLCVKVLNHKGLHI
jgi:hypothetical protein